MIRSTPVRSRSVRCLRHLTVCGCAALVLASLAAVSAHSVRGLQNGALALAFVSSPSAGADPSIPLSWGSGAGAVNTGLRVICFSVANPSPERVDRPGWPCITGVGLELPGTRSGFALVSPLGGEWELSEAVTATLPGHDPVTLDFAIRARVNPTGRTPGQPARPSGHTTRSAEQHPWRGDAFLCQRALPGRRSQPRHPG